MADISAPLVAWLERRVGAPVAVDGLRRVPGGSSRETWTFTARHGDTEERLVLRRDPSGQVVEGGRREEFELLRVAHTAGVPVPRMRWCEDDPAVLGGPFFVMEFVDGETIGRRLLRDDVYAPARTALPEQLAEAIARIHAMDASDPALAFLTNTPADGLPGAAEVARYEQVFRAIAPDPHPAIELALRWLAARVPASTRRTIVHGDYRIGNIIFGAEGLRAVIDWELAHLGDPLEDLGWLCVRAWRFGVDHQPVGGLCDRERLFRAYETASGVTVDRQAVRWWEVMGNLKWAVICIMQAHTHLSGAVRNVDLASIGRRTCETELELLELTED